MADSNIYVRLGGDGGGVRQSKISAKKSSGVSKQIIQQSQGGNGNTLKALKTIKSVGGSALGGSQSLLNTLTSYVPPVAIGYGLVKVGERIAVFGSQFRQSRSGESMLESNYRAKVKTTTNLGLNILYGQISNTLFTQPKIVRQNYALNYERQLYNYNVYSEKNKIR